MKTKLVGFRFPRPAPIPHGDLVNHRMLADDEVVLPGDRYQWESAAAWFPVDRVGLPVETLRARSGQPQMRFARLVLSEATT